MKTKKILFTLLLILATNLSAQNRQLSSVTLNWQDIQRYTVGTSYVDLISFEGAHYPNLPGLPTFTKRIACDPSKTYNAEVQQATFSSLTASEEKLIKGQTLPSTCIPTSRILTQQKEQYIEFTILPFIEQNGKILKLKSFNLVITENTGKQKVTQRNLYSYASSSKLSQGKFVKIRVTENGIYKVTYDELKNMGITPENVSLFGYGGAVLDQSFTKPKIDDLAEVPVWLEKGADGVFNSGDYMLFYGQGAVNFEYSSTDKTFERTVNTYSKYGYYFLSSDAGEKKRIEQKAITIPTNASINTITQFLDYKLFENDNTSFIPSGKEFYDGIFTNTNSYTFDPKFANIVPGSRAIANIAVATSAINSSNNFFTLSNNGISYKLYVSSTNDEYTFGDEEKDKFDFFPQNDAFTLKLDYNRPSTTTIGYLNYLILSVRRQLTMVGSTMAFQNYDYLRSNTYNKFQVSGVNDKTQIWDISNKQNINSIAFEKSNNQLTFTCSAYDASNYLAIDPSASAAFMKPEVIGVVPNQNLHGNSQTDFIIITHPDFLTQAEALAKAHREKDQMTVLVATTDQVYNEFSSGTPDATAYRWLAKMFYDRANGDKTKAPKYMLFFGKGTYDNRKLINSSGDNMILTYQTENSVHSINSYVTDDYFGYLDDKEGSVVTDGLMDIGVGRFPVKTVDEASDVVNKTINYIQNKNKGGWKNQLTFMADDGNSGSHTRESNDVASLFTESLKSYQVNKIYLDAYKQEQSATGESYPAAKSRLFSLLQAGQLMFNYTGHGGPGVLSSEQVITSADIKLLANKNQGIWVAAACDFNHFDTQAVSGGELALLNPIGGSIGTLAAARTVYSSGNFTLNTNFCQELFKKQNGEQIRLGEAIMKAKNRIPGEINKMSYLLFADPALKLNFPTQYQVLTTSINNNTTLKNDTLRALSVNTITGIIADDSQTVASNFNGKVHIILYDKEQTITLLNNDNDKDVVDLIKRFSYKDRLNILYSGDVVVVNGKFTSTIMLPKDIKYNFGTGRINYYAYDDVNNIEGQGYYENIIVGGTTSNYTVDTEGPEIDLYLNSERFISGGKVNETPLLLAKISDKSGINTVGTGIGHDLLMTIDKDVNQVYNLNNYYESAINSYTNGSVKYGLSTLENGIHTLTLKAWDLQNNSSTKTIEFEVVKGLTPEIFSVYNYPNPVVTGTNIIVEHDRPETVLSTSVEIFDLAGRKIWSFTQPSADNIWWDLNSNSGQKVKTGIYLYRVNIKTTNSDSCSKTNKLLIVESK